MQNIICCVKGRIGFSLFLNGKKLGHNKSQLHCPETFLITRGMINWLVKIFLVEIWKSDLWNFFETSMFLMSIKYSPQFYADLFFSPNLNGNESSIKALISCFGLMYLQFQKDTSCICIANDLLPWNLLEEKVLPWGGKIFHDPKNLLNPQLLPIKKIWQKVFTAYTEIQWSKYA